MAGTQMLTEEEILHVLKSRAADALELTPEDAGKITFDLPIVEGLQLDSLRQVVLLTAVEEAFGFEFEPEELAGLGDQATVRHLVEIVQRRASAS